MEMTDGGLDYTFECIGNVATMVSIHVHIWGCYGAAVERYDCGACSERPWRHVTRGGACPPSLVWLQQVRRSPHVHSSWSLAASGEALPLEVHVYTCTFIITYCCLHVQVINPWRMRSKGYGTCCVCVCLSVTTLGGGMAELYAQTKV